MDGFGWDGGLYCGAVLALWAVIAMSGWSGSARICRRSSRWKCRSARPRSRSSASTATYSATRGDSRQHVALKELPTHLPQAFIAIEDRRFYSHFGVDPIGIARAVVANILHRGVSQGGSTLTQQLAKNLFLTPERTLQRKIQERCWRCGWRANSPRTKSSSSI